MDERTAFVNDLPRNATEEEVRSLFSKAGEIEEIRLIMETNINKEKTEIKNKGFCYV